uniref:Uncharacterized protein n=1 Tax=Virus sp. ctAgr11 TaxID=2825800 RepID=A0A8S5RK10_9VIRU|nr:MAG TPA: hypothetical protein [Virus sp. ctAgr11]
MRAVVSLLPLSCNFRTSARSLFYSQYYPGREDSWHLNTMTWSGRHRRQTLRND